MNNKTFSLKFSQFSDYDFITNDLSKQLQLLTLYNKFILE